MLISGLKIDSSKVQLDVIFILAFIFKCGTGPQQKIAIGSGIIPALISLLSSAEDKTVCGEVLATLRSIIEINASLDHFHNSNIIPTLIQVGERVAENKECLIAIAWITIKFCWGRKNDLDPPQGKTGKAKEQMLLSLQLLPEVFQLCHILMRERNDEVIGSTMVIQVALALTAICKVEASFEAIVTSGIVPLVAESLSSSRKSARLPSTLAIAEVFELAESDGEVLQFFEALKGSTGMKEMWKNIFEADGDSADETFCKKKCSLQLNRFFEKVRRALEGELGPKLIEAMFQSGFVHTLVKFLEKEAPFQPQVSAVYLLEKFLREMGEGKVELILEMGVVPLILEQLKSTSDKARSFAPVCLRDLMKAKSTVRDEIVSRGGLHQMIRMLKKENRDVGAVASLLICFEEMFRHMPRLPLEQFKGLAEALKTVWGNMARFSRKNAKNAADVSTMIFACLKGIADYGASGIELLRTSSNFSVLIGGLSSDLHGVQQLAMEMIVHASLIQQENREALMKLGVLDSFPELFRSPFDKIIQLVLTCLKVFLDGKLSAGQTKVILGMKSLVQAEMSKDRKNTSKVASRLLARMGEIEK